MPEYRFYKIRRDGHVNGLPHEAECPDDLTAVREARQYVDGCDIEIWQGPRIVSYLTPESIKIEKKV